MLAVLFTFVPSTGQTMGTPVDWGENPIESAWALKASLEDDWPGALWSVAADAEAQAVAANARMKQLLGDDWEPEGSAKSGEG